MNSRDILNEVRSSEVIPHHDVRAHFDTEYLREQLGHADREFDHHRRKRFIRSTVRTARGANMEALFYQTNIRIVLAVKWGGQWRQAACRYHF